jgi:phosphatidylserine/phosphatidylglycerophosphate/cardiolipin synthase-like enzyme
MSPRFLLCSFATLVVACSGARSGVGSNETDVQEATSEVRIVEVLSRPVTRTAAFIELRNDSDVAGSLGSATLTVDDTTAPLRAIGVGARAPNPVLEGHGLALVVDDVTPPDAIERAACEAPIATAREDLGEAHASADDILMGSIDLARKERRCIPVFVWSGLAASLEGARRLSLDSSTTHLDSATAGFRDAPLGLSLERRSLAEDAFALSPLGATPGARNFASSDASEQAGGAPAIRVMNASPWRAGTPRLRTDPLPENPLASELTALLSTAQRSVGAAFYQLNEPNVIDGLVAAKARGAAVEITTDASFKDARSYVAGWEKLGAASIPVHFDTSEAGADRAPLSHNKFLVLDEEWVWTGSYNPVEDDSARIHADNAVLLRSRSLAALHTGELLTMFGGKYGTQKRGEGVSGGSAFVDGAEVITRFSPGFTDAQAKARALALSRTGDARTACAALGTNGRPVLDPRYSGVAPCGGPLDLLYEEVARATSSVYLVQFGFALGDLADLMTERATKGNVEIKGVVDATISTKPLPRRLAEVGDIRVTPNSDPDCPSYITPKTTCPVNLNKVWLHHKFMIVDYGTDHPVVITGSHNMSDGAEQQNDESLVVIRDRAVAESYYRIFREIFDHPQTLGPRRPAADAPALGITRVLASVDPVQPSVVELTSFDARPTSLAGLSLWNRTGTVALDASAAIPAHGRLWLVSGPREALRVPADVTLVALPDGFVGPASALVVQTQDHGWLATFDPYTSAATAKGNSAWTPGKALTVGGVDAGLLDALTTELLGVNATPGAPVPTWTQRGTFSDWIGGYDVTRAGLALWKMHQARITAESL